MSGVTNYKGAHIVGVPTSKYPDMVQIISAPKKFNSLVGKKYITEKKCITTLDRIDTERLINDYNIRSDIELQKLRVE